MSNWLYSPVVVLARVVGSVAHLGVALLDHGGSRAARFPSTAEVNMSDRRLALSVAPSTLPSMSVNIDLAFTVTGVAG
ncbi:hypothetical protein, partial [Streptomyces sp. SID1034]|uniref:hypothetical protein n=1 Tax=Streptomyces sp. SID1034 TaxID=2690248 RepID=UPI001F483A50